MRTLITAAAVALLILSPLRASAEESGDPVGEWTSQMHEWVEYKRPAFKPLEVQVDGATLIVLDAIIESHPFEEDVTIVRVIMRARRGEKPAEVRNAVLKGHDGVSYPAAYVKAPPVKILEEKGFRVYNFRLPETDQEELKSLAVTVASAKEGAEPASAQVELAVGEQVRFSDLDFATFSALPAFFFFFYYFLTTASGV